MFVLRNVGKLIFGGSGATEAVLEIPQGQLYLVRPLSPKGYSELLFKDAVAQIRISTQNFNYQLVIQRAYEEGEAELYAEQADDDELDDIEADKDERSFLLDEALHFRVENRPGSEKVLCWKDLRGDDGDVYEFVCASTTPSDLVERFYLTARQCQYERKYRKPHNTASLSELAQFEFEEQPIPPASPITNPTIRALPPLDLTLPDSEPLEEKHVMKNSISPDASTEIGASPSAIKKSSSKAPPTTAEETTTSKQETPLQAETFVPPPASSLSATVNQKLVELKQVELHFFDFPSGSFILQDAAVDAVVNEIGKWKYSLRVFNAVTGKLWLELPVVTDMNPVFNFEFLSFIFNQFTPDGKAYSWLLRFRNQTELGHFQEGLLQALWEQLNEIKWTTVKQPEKDYVADAFKDLSLDDKTDDDENEENEEEDLSEAALTENASREQEDEEDEADEEDDRGGVIRESRRQGQNDSDEDDEKDAPDDGNVNSQLAVGYKYDRSFVVRGSKIGVFRHTEDNNLEFATSIAKIEDKHGQLFSPKKVMLHNEDRNLILQSEKDANSLFRMDLEYGKVVDEWKVHDDIPVVTFAPENKFAQMTHEPTFLGVSHNSLYRVDPRLSGTKLVDSQLKQYASKNDFSALATTEKGHIAVASNKGDIRLFDRVGINAKTLIPALGEAIIGMDVSADGRWVLATCKTYLLLIDAQQKSGKWEGKLGFEKPFAADNKPQPRRLALTPEHVAQFSFETGKGISFTPAKFNTGESSQETSIISATGPYIIEWNLQKIIAGRKGPYKIKRYQEEVKADDFKFGTDKDVIVALPNEVDMVAKQSLKRPTRESIAGNFGFRRLSSMPRKSTGRQSLRGHLGRDDIVKSAF